MAGLFVFDFDKTIVDEDSDATIIRLLSEKKTPPEWEQSNYDWTPFMDDIFEHAFLAGLTKEDILEAIGRMRATAGMKQLISALAEKDWTVILITDSNSVFVHHWLKCNDLEDKITHVITNRAYFESSGRLHIEPYSNQRACARCPANLCKSLALAQFQARAHTAYDKIAYCGDGRNDYCPITTLGPEDLAFPRKGYPCDKLIEQSTPSVKAKVSPWEDGFSIYQQLFPDTAPRISHH